MHFGIKFIGETDNSSLDFENFKSVGLSVEDYYLKTLENGIIYGFELNDFSINVKNCILFDLKCHIILNYQFRNSIIINGIIDIKKNDIFYNYAKPTYVIYNANILNLHNSYIEPIDF